jgi:hypothetical protein
MQGQQPNGPNPNIPGQLGGQPGFMNQSGPSAITNNNANKIGSNTPGSISSNPNGSDWQLPNFNRVFSLNLIYNFFFLI